ncbi:hypothetical protein PHYBOEH_008593 [Phytophthora boehmeriae]|uniref:Calmodulin n=1 Tax=Phytophthora boehmeriae TaxID=109152 RepID=A0A8T1VZF9_9STRA|nr:hypothetical protein PHYBOEH_008593 [Phytophthora boehmeriae]
MIAAFLMSYVVVAHRLGDHLQANHRDIHKLEALLQALPHREDLLQEHRQDAVHRPAHRQEHLQDVAHHRDLLQVEVRHQGLLQERRQDVVHRQGHLRVEVPRLELRREPRRASHLQDKDQYPAHLQEEAHHQGHLQDEGLRQVPLQEEDCHRGRLQDEGLRQVLLQAPCPRVEVLLPAHLPAHFQAGRPEALHQEHHQVFEVLRLQEVLQECRLELCLLVWHLQEWQHRAQHHQECCQEAHQEHPQECRQECRLGVHLEHPLECRLGVHLEHPLECRQEVHPEHRQECRQEVHPEHPQECRQEVHPEHRQECQEVRQEQRQECQEVRQEQRQECRQEAHREHRQECRQGCKALHYGGHLQASRLHEPRLAHQVLSRRRRHPQAQILPRHLVDHLPHPRECHREAHLVLLKLGMMDTADPYVKLTIGTQNVQTKVVESGGKTPEFNETFDFNIATEKELVVEVWDQEKGGQDRFMAQAKVDIVPWLGKGSFEGDVELQDRAGGTAGKLAVTAKFTKPEAAAAGPVKSPPSAPPILSGPAVAPLPPGSNAISAPGVQPVAPSEPPRDPNGKFTDKEILEAFQAFDLDHNNYVGAAEIRHVLINIGEAPTDEEVDEMIKMVDKDGDGQVSFDEFYAMVTKGKQPPPGLGAASASPDKAPSAGVGAAASGAQAIQLRNQRKVALEEFARDNGIKPESVKKAYKRFQATDKDGSGQIDYSEFCEVLQVDPSPQCEKVFQLFDNDKMGRIDVREFMIALSNFTGAEKEEKLKFAFLVFDEDGNGVITRQELMKILKANHMATNESEVARKADTIMSQGDKDGDGVISFDEFSIVSKKFPNILFPAYTLGTAKD